MRCIIRNVHFTYDGCCCCSVVVFPLLPYKFYFVPVFCTEMPLSSCRFKGKRDVAKSTIISVIAVGTLSDMELLISLVEKLCQIY